jgi:hypothetical protein
MDKTADDTIKDIIYDVECDHLNIETPLDSMIYAMFLGFVGFTGVTVLIYIGMRFAGV